MLEPTVFLTSDRKVALRAHQMKSTKEWVFSVLDLIVEVGDIKKKYTETAAHVWLHAVANITDSDVIHNCPLVVFPGPNEDPEGTPCINALGLSVLYSHMLDHFGHRVIKEYEKEVMAKLREMITQGNNLEVKEHDDGEVDPKWERRYAGTKRRFSYLVGDMEMTEGEILSMRNDYIERMQKMGEKHAEEKMKLLSSLELAQNQLATITAAQELEAKKKKGFRLKELLEDLNVKVADVSGFGARIKGLFEGDEFNGTTFKHRDVVHYFADDRTTVEKLVRREMLFLEVESVFNPKPEIAQGSHVA